MGPLFSLLLVALVLFSIVVAAFLVAVPFQPVKWAMCSAVVFSLGIFGGVALAVLSLYPLFGSETLDVAWQLLLYFCTLLLAGLLSGGALLWLFFRANRANGNFKRAWLKSSKT